MSLFEIFKNMVERLRPERTCGRKRGNLMVKEKLIRFIRKIFKIHSPSAELTRGNVYVEEDTKCDLCEYLNECIDARNVLDCTCSMDTRKHYVPGLGLNCMKLNLEINSMFEIVDTTTIGIFDYGDRDEFILKQLKRHGIKNFESVTVYTYFWMTNNKLYVFGDKILFRIIEIANAFNQIEAQLICEDFVGREE